MRSLRWSAAAAAVLLGVSASEASAQTCTGNPCTVQVTASATAPDILRLTLSATTAALGNPTEADYDARLSRCRWPDGLGEVEPPLAR